MEPRLINRGNVDRENSSVIKELRRSLRALENSGAADISDRLKYIHNSLRMQHFHSASGSALRLRRRTARKPADADLSRFKTGIPRQLPRHDSRKQTRLNLQDATVAHTISEQRVRHQRVHP